MSEDADLGAFASERERPEPTYRWCPGGTVCATCGERSERVWWADGEPRCPDCKPWNV